MIGEFLSTLQCCVRVWVGQRGNVCKCMGSMGVVTQGSLACISEPHLPV